MKNGKIKQTFLFVILVFIISFILKLIWYFIGINIETNNVINFIALVIICSITIFCSIKIYYRKNIIEIQELKIILRNLVIISIILATLSCVTSIYNYEKAIVESKNMKMQLEYTDMSEFTPQMRKKYQKMINENKKIADDLIETLENNKETKYFDKVVRLLLSIIIYLGIYYYLGIYFAKKQNERKNL